ncbi:CHAP domain-containing protein [Candidatus Odyssella thessalonicensis]|uniref:CHAP domain-containing protein n=1 Tax=Candidatus Odyssella thessalonicensis TaxID=84647 RepID=UPI000225ABEB|nr:CHAP domain-containing protein [Candidatus Odyssella thessalonicensis]
MIIQPASLKLRFAALAYQEGRLCLTGNACKAGPDIEKYLKVFRQALGRKDPKYLDAMVGYDWCCAYVHYLLQLIDVKLAIQPLTHSDWMLGAVRTWYLWARQENIFLPASQQAEPGDLVLFDQLIDQVELDHIGIVLQDKGDHILTSEGNYHNRSGIFIRPRNPTIRGYIRL